MSEQNEGVAGDGRTGSQRIAPELDRGSPPTNPVEEEVVDLSMEVRAEEELFNQNIHMGTSGPGSSPDDAAGGGNALREAEVRELGSDGSRGSPAHHDPGPGEPDRSRDPSAREGGGDELRSPEAEKPVPDNASGRLDGLAEQATPTPNADLGPPGSGFVNPAQPYGDSGDAAVDVVGVREDAANETQAPAVGASAGFPAAQLTESEPSGGQRDSAESSGPPRANSEQSAVPGEYIEGTAARDRLEGSAGDDRVKAGAGNDRIDAGAGNDRIDGGEGHDEINAGEGNDRVVADAGNDRVDGGAGNDRIDAGEGNNRVVGGAGDDRITALDGNDRISGGDGADRIAAGEGNNRVDAGAGNDRVTTGGGRDTVSGGAGNDRISSGAGNDRVDGGAGNDFLDGGAGNDVVTGGDGDDTYAFGGFDGSDSFDGGQAGGWTDVVQLDASSNPGAPADSPWTVEVNGEEVAYDMADGGIELGADVSGVIKLADGSELRFDNIERIEW